MFFYLFYVNLLLMEKRYFIVDDHSMLRSGIINWISENSDWKCVGDAETHEEAYEKLEENLKNNTFPDILISDINFNGENSGFSFIKSIHEKYTNLKITVYSMFFSPGVMKESITCGASGYISKNAKSEELLVCMDSILNGKIYLEQNLVQNYMRYTNIIDALTKREVVVVGYLLQHKSNDEIAKSLGLKKRSVENYISSIYEKIGVMDRAELIAKLS